MALRDRAGIISGANFYGDSLVFGSYDNSLYALRRDDGTLLWKVETDGYVHGTPAVTGEFTHRRRAATASCGWSDSRTARRRQVELGG